MEVLLCIIGLLETLLYQGMRVQCNVHGSQHDQHHLVSLIRLSILRHKGYIKRVALAVFEDYKSNQFHKVLIFFRSSGNFPDHLESFQAMQKLSRPSRNIPKSSENVFVFQCKQFKVG